MVIKVAISVINSDKLSRSHDDFYLQVTFWDTGAINTGKLGSKSYVNEYQIR